MNYEVAYYAIMQVMISMEEKESGLQEMYDVCKNTNFAKYKIRYYEEARTIEIICDNCTFCCDLYASVQMYRKNNKVSVMRIKDSHVFMRIKLYKLVAKVKFAVRCFIMDIELARQLIKELESICTIVDK